MENYNRKKREAEEEEKRRLLKLVEHEYRYKSDTYDSASNTLTTPTRQEKQHQQATKCYEPLKDHSQDTVLEDGGLMAMTTRKGRSDTIYSVDGMNILLLIFVFYNLPTIVCVNTPFHSFSNVVEFYDHA